LEILTDSKYCRDYINGKATYNVVMVVKRMCQLKYLFYYCDIKKYFEQVKIEKRNISPFIRAEKLSLDNCDDYMTSYPWMNKKFISTIPQNNINYSFILFLINILNS
jgi:hypothetical protein